MGLTSKQERALPSLSIIVNGTLDTPETVEPTPIVIIEGLHPFVDERVRKLLDFSIYLDISDDIKFAWKIQRDMAQRGWTKEQVLESIEQRKPDFSAYVEPQMKDSDVVLSVLPSETSKADVGKHLKLIINVKLSLASTKRSSTIRNAMFLLWTGNLLISMDLRKLKNFSRIPLLRIQQSCQMISLKSDLMRQGPLMVLASFRPSPLSS